MRCVFHFCSKSLTLSLNTLQLSDSLDFPQCFLNVFSKVFSILFDKLSTIFLQFVELRFDEQYFEKSSSDMLSAISNQIIDISLFASVSNRDFFENFAQTD